jgi:hypothetical protein
MAGRIILMSGVSGGGVSAAYFYAHRDALLDPSAESDAEWFRFKKRMAEPFIGDVLEGAAEWRVVSREPLARLLVESFERRLFAINQRQATMGDSDQMALILNTTITAHPQEDSDLLRGAFTNSTSASAPCDVRHIPYGLMGGGRLLFTNLQDRNAFPPSGAAATATAEIQVPDVRLPYVVVQDPHVSLAAASALTANFPPVFTSARVDVASEVADRACPYRTYYVTDGGANENLGLVSALYALRAALAELAPGEIPAIHIVTIEASQELLNDVKRLGVDATGDAKRVQIHDLALPLAFRSRGGFGTHWMFPGSVVIANPRLAQPRGAYQHLIPRVLAKDSDSAALDQQQIVALWTALHDPDRDFCGRSWDTDSRRVAGWICAIPADLHIAEWRRLVGSVRAAP